jgi:hypothetical protein
VSRSTLLFRETLQGKTRAQKQSQVLVTYFEQLQGIAIWYANL